MPRPVLLLSLLVLLPAYAAEPPQSPARQPIAQPVPRETRWANALQLASDGSGFLGVWQDELSDISGARYSSDGDLVDPVEFPVVTTWRGGLTPAMTWNGREYVVLGWAQGLGVFPVRVTPAGEVVPGPGPIPDLLPQEPASLAWNGSLYAYPVKTVGAYYSLSVAFLDPNLSLVKGVKLIDNIDVRSAQVATDGSGFLVVWEVITDREDIVIARRFDSSGNASGPQQHLRTIPRQPGGILRPVVTWNGSHYFVVWTAGVVEGVLIAGDGTVGSSFTISAEEDARDVAAGWDGVAHLVTWSHKATDMSPQGVIVYRPAAAFVTATGELLERMDVPAALPRSFGVPGRATIASNGSVFLIVWFGERFVVSSTLDPHVRRHFNWTTRRYESQAWPAVAAGASNLLAAWTEGGVVYAGRLSKRGEPLDGVGIPIAIADARNVTVRWTDGVYLICWQGYPPSAARVTESGELLDPEPIPLATSGDPIVAAKPGAFRLIWGQWNSSRFPGHAEIVTTEIPARGAVDAHVSDPLFPATLPQVQSALVWTGSSYTLLWTQILSQPCYGSRCPPAQYEVRATILDSGGRPLNTRVVMSDGGVFDAVRAHENSLLIAYARSGLRYTQRMRPDGELIGVPNLMPTGYPEARLVRTPAGFLLFEFNRLVQLDADGAPISAVVTFLEGEDRPRASDIASDGGRAWVVYVAGWRPRPTTTSGIGRAYIYTTGPRTRIASH